MMVPVRKRERLLIVNDPGELARFVRGRYPQLDVNVAQNSLAGIVSLAQGETRGVLFCIDPSARKLDNAIAGLRKAAGKDVRLVLCCQPSGEPAAREGLAAGADDYVLYPPQGGELDEALDMPKAADLQVETADTTVLPTWEELSALAERLCSIRCAGSSRSLCGPNTSVSSPTLKRADTATAT
jgi:hypothetical protein